MSATPFACIATTVALVAAYELYLYILALPAPGRKALKISELDTVTGKILYCMAGVLAVLRLPLAIVPYALKFSYSLARRRAYRILDHSYPRQAVHVAGDFANLIATGFLLRPYLPPLAVLIPVTAEAIRITCERGQMIFSGAWQCIPHRSIACRIRRSRSDRIRHLFGKYTAYYSLDDAGRSRYVHQSLSAMARDDRVLRERLRYVHGFRILSPADTLRGGVVRDVAAGEIFINPLWTADPWLLIGLAIRRSPWRFDPRFLPRPFYYRTVSSRLATRSVFERARYSLPYFIYQFGHEVKDARYGQFYRVLHAFGIHVEEHVLSDGAYPQDQLLRWLDRKLHGSAIAEPARPLWSDDEVIADIGKQARQGAHVSAADVACRYTYPMEYVTEVLMAKIEERAAMAGMEEVDDGQRSR
jgi:hypothetical protein